MAIGLFAARSLMKSAPAQNLDADKQLAAITQADWNRFSRQSVPMIHRMADGINDTSIIDQAYAQTEGSLENTQARLDRSLGRRTRTMSAAQQKAMRDRLASTVALDSTATINQAHINQRDVNQQAATQSMGYANALGNMGTQTITGVAGAQNARAQAEAQARANRRSGIMGTVGAIGGMALGAMVGGPMGAAAGAQIGGSIGG